MLTIIRTASSAANGAHTGTVASRGSGGGGGGISCSSIKAQSKGMSSASDRTAPPAAASSSRAIRIGWMPAARAPSTSASGVSPTCQVSSGRVPASSSAAAKIAPSGLAEPTSAEAIAPSTSVRETRLLQALVQREVPVGDDDGPDAALAQRPQRGRAVGVGVEAQRVHQGVKYDVDREGQLHRPRAAHAQVVQRAGVGAVVAGGRGSRRSRPGSRPRRPPRRCPSRCARAAPRAGAARAARR